MLVTRQCDTGRNTWSSRKFEDVFHNAASPRMSNFESLSTQPDWREQYSNFPLPGENGLLQPSFEQVPSPEVSDGNRNEQQQTGARPPLEHRHTLGPLQQESQPLPVVERPHSATGDCGQAVTSTRDDSLASTETTALSLDTLGSNQLSSVSSAPTHQLQQGSLAINDVGDINVDIKDEEDDEELDDDEMLDAEEGSVPQTAAERRAERRKMKRFRYGTIETSYL